MGTKANPGQFDCYANAYPDEPLFVLLARDPDFYRLVTEWASKREADIDCGERPEDDRKAVEEARNCATQGAIWRRNNLGKWRVRPRNKTQAARGDFPINAHKPGPV